MTYLEYFLYIRLAIIWGNKDLSSVRDYFYTIIANYS
jgi:hypothetical protein